MLTTDLLPLSAVAGIAVVAAATDLRDFKVYNWLTLPALAAGLIASTVLNGPTGLVVSALGMLVGFTVLAFFFALGGVGAGDVKLFAAVGAWLGPWPVLQVFAASALVAGAYALVLIVMSRGVEDAAVGVAVLGHRMVTPRLWSAPARGMEAEVRREDRRRRLVPFAAASCLGYFVVLALWVAPFGGPR